ncbi:putative hydroxymethylpyrimidine transporter CytX [Paludicola sp. MB14-C6]|uniref:putative hydroxymethylpyrimidine transporter CytX n=1 Tax=Paludihabitans sp. MB14-C6 TaxID=3070656 RepID=UPI0027DDABF5|nr:putative hydroxymethylpyrimidine transporter CytX [Paludicola sp. MB14-C6]WMJ23249.1 putative hydroxymethylpyrimidine transporter CytX [Paludicola sp. MB14-C6]
MNETKTSLFSNGLIWFGAAVSIAEILTGTLIAPLGFGKGLCAILLGHFIGCVLLYFAGLIGAYTEKSSMETVKMSFGEKGSLLFSSLNVLQLVGWTAVMIVSGAAAAHSIANIGGQWAWSIIIGLLIIIWILVGIKNLNKLNIIAMGVLFVLTIVLSVVIFQGDLTSSLKGNISFGAAVELSVAMPLSWLPLISDYTRYGKSKKGSTLTSAVVYFFTSCWMYIIGMGAAIFTGENDIAKILMGAGLGITGILIVVFSTVTTTFLDAYSAGVSSVSISKKLNEKWVAVVVCGLGTFLAIFTPITKLEDFLYLIGSVFAPMIAIIITDYFILKKDYCGKALSLKNLIIWLFGFIIYRVFLHIDTIIGNTLPVMIIVVLVCVIVNKCSLVKRK